MDIRELKGRFQEVAGDGREYRGVPFWSWNDDLDPEELRRQIREMAKAGLGGYFMHARVGLITPYMGQRWMECVRACIDEGRKTGMASWLYDEDCWPSGTASGKIPARGEDYRAKWLCCVESSPAEFAPNQRTIAALVALRESGRLVRVERLADLSQAAGQPGTILHFFYQVGDYVDVMSRQAIHEFIESTYETYYREVGQEFGQNVPGIFTDEPNYTPVPWSLDLPAYFRAKKGYDIAETLPGLFYPVGQYHKARYDFWSTVSSLYVESFSQQIGTWCSQHGLAFTGHQLYEDSLQQQVSRIGAAMPHYEHMQIPGIDHLRRVITDPLLCKQVSSIAHQFGGRRVLSEMYGCSGWNVSFEELKWIAEWQFVLGVDLICQHLSLYSLRGCRKRDYPPSLHYQQPWWEDYRLLNDYFARLLFTLTQGKHVADILVLHPIGSAWTIYDPTDEDRVALLNREFSSLSENLLKVHYDYDYGDETIVERHARVEAGKLVVGACTYSVVVVPPSVSICRSTLELLRDYIAVGGKVLCVDQLPTMIEGVPSDEPTRVLGHCPRVPNQLELLKLALHDLLPPAIQVLNEAENDASTIYYQQRDLGAVQLFFLTNISQESSVPATIRIGREGHLERWDLETGQTEVMECRYEGHQTILRLPFLPMQSHLLVLDTSTPGVRPTLATTPLSTRTRQIEVVECGDIWQLRRSDPNALTLDYCRYALDGGGWSESLPVIRLREELDPLDRPAALRIRFAFDVLIDMARQREMMLVMELPEEYAITVNGQAVEYEALGWWRDISFKKMDIAGLVKRGDNTIELARPFPGGAALRRQMAADATDEAQRNRLKYGVELENIYITGDFAVASRSPLVAGERRTVNTLGPFVLIDETDTVRADDLVRQGYCFYAGRVRLRQTVILPPKFGRRVRVQTNPPDAIVTKLRVNGQLAGTRAWQPYCFDVTDLMVEGENDLEIELASSCRNLLGPHHHFRGELYSLGPMSFTGRSSWYNGALARASTWVDRYCFVRFGLRGGIRVELA